LNTEGQLVYMGSGYSGRYFWQKKLEKSRKHKKRKKRHPRLQLNLDWIKITGIWLHNEINKYLYRS